MKTRRMLMSWFVMTPPLGFMVIGLIDIHRQRVEAAAESYAIATAMSLVIAWIGRDRIVLALIRFEDRWLQFNRNSASVDCKSNQ